VSVWLIVRSEKDGSCKDALECLDDPPIVPAVLRQVKKIKHLSGAVKVNGAAFLADGERRYPDRNQAVLAERKAIGWMAGDLQKKLSVASGVDELILWRAAKRDAT